MATPQVASAGRRCGSCCPKKLLTSWVHVTESGQNSVEELWQQFFSCPSQWWDNRIAKANPRYPDFKNKKTGVGLWIDWRSTPLWVKSELASMIPGSAPRSLFSWNAMLSRFVKSEQGQKALALFRQMQSEGVKPDSLTFVRVLNACSSLSSLEEGRNIHAEVVRSGWESDVFVGCSLVDMYAKCGSMDDAWRVFQSMPRRDVVSWTVMLAGFVKCDQGGRALELFSQMEAEGVKPDPVTFVTVLNACGSTARLEDGKRIHTQASQSGCLSDVFVGSSLVDMYSKCGSLDDAWRVFQTMPTRNVFSWNAMIAGCVSCEQGHKALKLFEQMQSAGVKADNVTYLKVLNACASLGALEEGKRIHAQISQRKVTDISVGNTLIDMYAKCGSIDDASRVFHGMVARNVVSWTAMMTGFVKCEQGEKALDLFEKMCAEGVKPDHPAFVMVLNACASVTALEAGKCFHAQLIQNSCEPDVRVGNTLVDMYAKCGSIDDAWRVFHNMPTCDVVSWTAMIGGLAMNGLGNEAVHLFEEMSKVGMKMNAVTFVCLLSACSHAGLVEEGIHYFEAMSSVYDISPTVDHYVCLVDLLGRAGLLSDAENILKRTEKDESLVLMVLLDACRKFKKVEMEELIAKRVNELEPHTASAARKEFLNCSYL